MEMLSGILHAMEITETQKQEIVTLARKYGLSLVVLFGSQATGKTHPKSDIDIGVIAESDLDYQNTYQLEQELAPIFRRRDIEAVNLNSVSPLLLFRVASQGRLLYEAHAGEFIKLKVRALRRYVETAPLRKMERPRLEHFLQKHGG
ncbi:MAG TPA: hypothetical protein DEF00_03300 [Candidatus Taylorbacteria bacterium]|nr:MAG: polymerase beta domain protein region protein [Parcubacteria group bacterium GW2011_GWA2_47_64]KKU95925.1 MAG: polymerase beta domain protein region protein [Parcubacteria group bacterium GW2011_GWC2_48_17]HBV01391.1 hypothetical protein [Candidatus Taylorbacteria bacterium]